MTNIKYPAGIKPDLNNKNDTSKLVKGYARMGLDLESDIIKSCEYYARNNICLILKRPTPIQIMKVDNFDNKDKNCLVTGKFNLKSTTDFVGVYRGRYIDIECKKTIQNSFQMKNIGEHQIKHHTKAMYLGGICFFIIYMERFDKIFLLDSKYVIEKYTNDDKTCISIKFLEQFGYELERGYLPRIDFIKVVDKVYFDTEFDKNNPSI